MKIITINNNLFAIHFQILSELSAWNDYICSAKTRQIWLKQSGGQLFSKEQEMLKNFAIVLRQAPAQTWANFITSTQSERQILEKQEKLKKVLLITIKASDALKLRIMKLEKIYKPNLNKVRKFLKIKYKQLLNGIQLFHNFLDVQDKIYSFKLIILLPKPEGFECWAYQKNKIIIIPPLNEQLDYLLKAIIHEYGHLVFRNNRKFPQQIKFILQQLNSQQIKELNRYGRKNGLSKRQIIEELFLSSLAPEGLLAELLLPDCKSWKTSKKADDFERLRLTIAKKIRPAVKKCWQNKITIDEYWNDFCSKIVTIL